MCSFTNCPEPEKQFKAVREHLRERRYRLGDDGGVVTLAGSVDGAEGQPCACKRRPEPPSQAKPLWPCRRENGAKWSEHIAAWKPAASARVTKESRSAGENCSCDA